MHAGAHRCPLCHRIGFQVIYYGLPARVCSAQACSCLWAHWSIEWLLTRLPVVSQFDYNSEGRSARASGRLPLAL